MSYTISEIAINILTDSWKKSDLMLYLNEFFKENYKVHQVLIEDLNKELDLLLRTPVNLIENRDIRQYLMKRHEIVALDEKIKTDLFFGGTYNSFTPMDWWSNKDDDFPLLLEVLTNTNPNLLSVIAVLESSPTEYESMLKKVKTSFGKIHSKGWKYGFEDLSEYNMFIDCLVFIIENNQLKKPMYTMTHRKGSMTKILQQVFVIQQKYRGHIDGIDDVLIQEFCSYLTNCKGKSFEDIYNIMKST